jgi:hypothetical protein
MRKCLFILLFVPLMSMGQEKSCLVSKVKYYSLPDVVEAMFFTDFASSLKVSLGAKIVSIATESNVSYYLQIETLKKRENSPYYSVVLMSYQELVECIEFMQRAEVEAPIEARGGEHDLCEGILQGEQFKLMYSAKGNSVSWYIRLSSSALEDNVILSEELAFNMLLNKAKAEIDKLMSAN